MHCQQHYRRYVNCTHLSKIIKAGTSPSFELCTVCDYAMDFGLGLKRDDINFKIAHVGRKMAGEEPPAEEQAADNSGLL